MHIPNYYGTEAARKTIKGFIDNVVNGKEIISKVELGDVLTEHGYESITLDNLRVLTKAIMYIGLFRNKAKLFTPSSQQVARP